MLYKNIIFTRRDNLLLQDNVIPIGVKLHQSKNETSIPVGIIRIGERYFENCRKLTNITIPGSVELIGVFVLINVST